MVRSSIYIAALFLSIVFFASSQTNIDFSCEIHKVFPPLSIERVALDEATTIKDIHSQYKPEWVKEFIGVQIHTINNGEKKVATSKDDQLSAAQLENLRTSDHGADIYLNIDYLPNNTLKNNEPKSYDASFRINPDQDATFATGQKSLKSYLQNNISNKIPADTFEQYALAAVKFTVADTGNIEDVSIAESSKSESVDQLMYDAICNMPKWQAATYQDGSKAAQDFVLAVGSMQSCIVPTLNIKRY